MGSVEELQKELTVQESQLTIAQQKVRDANSAFEKDPDEVNKGVFVKRQEEVKMIQDKITQLKQMMAESVQAGRQSMAAERDPTGMEPDDHMTQKSMLRYGNTLDVNPIDLDEPSGQTADWVSIIGYIITFVDAILLKGLYLLTTRGRQTVKDNKGTRIRLKDDTSFVDTDGIKKPRHLYISMPNAQSSMRADELTPGRYRTVVCGLYPANVKAKVMISPVMGVIGFPTLAKNWEDRIEEFMAADCPFLKQALSVLSGGNENNRTFFMDRQAALKKMETPESQAIKEMLQGKSCSCPDSIESPSAIWIFAGAPDRCPPTAIYVAGLAELGAFFSILQDMRNTIIASKTVGTAEEKLRKKSSFYQSYLRRTQSMGVQLDQRIIILFMNAWGKEAVDHFHLGDDMDPELRLTAQALIDQKVKEISNQEPLKL
uniref:Nucleoprotein n=1 Tax=Jemez Springs virus TaxID=466215 RepID=A0A076E8P1_9VIRU|nr:nucleocapsid protein [Jemez Springs virus]QDZ59851.1 nucleocapsid protein [Jemez Springs virus]